MELTAALAFLSIGICAGLVFKAIFELFHYVIKSLAGLIKYKI